MLKRFFLMVFLVSWALTPQKPILAQIPSLPSGNLGEERKGIGQMLVVMPNSAVRAIIYEAQEGYAVAEGDILLGKLPSHSTIQASILHKIGGERWTQGIVPYEFNDDLPMMSKLYVLQAIAYWQEKTAIRFIELTSENRHLYPDYLSFTPIDGRLCSSFVGKQKGPQIVILAPRCNKMIIVHEIGHALGLWHEQSRNDRDSYIRINWQNIQEGHTFNFLQRLNDGEDFGNYDYDSIMHYSEYAFSKNGEKTIIPLLEYVKIGQTDHLSKRDIEAIAHLYPDAF